MTIYGLSNNGYCINNPIYLSVHGANNVAKYDIIVATLDPDYPGNYVISCSAINGKIKINIAPTIKALFKKPSHDYNGENNGTSIYENSARQKIDFTIRMYLKGGNIPIETKLIQGKYFFRAGTFYNGFDVVLSMGKTLLNTQKLPYWENYPVEEYHIGQDYNIFRRELENVGASRKELMPDNTCNPIYIKFLNALGGYSFWLFDSQTEIIKTTNTGFYNQHNKENADYGNQIDRKMSLFSKVPQRYFSIIRELIVSPEIYWYDKSNNWRWQRIINDNNSFETNNDRKFQEVSLSFIMPTNYNPQLSWQ